MSAEEKGSSNKDELIEVDQDKYDLMIPYSAYRRLQRAMQECIGLTYREQMLLGGKMILGFLGLMVAMMIPTLPVLLFGQLPWLAFLTPFVLTGFLYYVMIDTTRQQLGPTSIQLGKAGIRFLWIHPLFRFTSPWIDWSLVEFVQVKDFRKFVIYGFMRGKRIDISVKLWAAPAPVRKFLSRLRLTGLSRRPNRNTVEIRIDTKAIIHENDVPRLVSYIEKTVSQDFIDPSLKSLIAIDPDTSFTKLWLEKFGDVQDGTTANELQVGGTVYSGRFTVIRVVAAGGHAITYLASDRENDDVSVALKEIVLPIAGGREIYMRALRNVMREAELLKKLDHPQIVKCLDFFVENGRAYIVQNFIEGNSLRHLVSESGPLNESMTIDLIKQMGEILSYLHDLVPPVIHRDFTPDNMILQPDNKLVLVDFNVAEQREAFESATVVGKHAYIPPEQFRGQATTHSDIYALGCCAHYLLTGEDPEPITVSHPAVSKPNINPNLDALVAAATQARAEARYQSIESLLEAPILRAQNTNQ